MEPIESGLSPEKGPLQLFTFAGYISPEVIKDFEQTYDVEVQMTTFTTANEAMAKLTSRNSYDVYLGVATYQVNPLAAGKLIRPLNHDYLPNLKNVWELLQDPWYDVGAQYTVPNIVYTTGIAWREDKLGGSFDPASLANPYDVFWQADDIAGKVGLLDDMRDCLSMAILRNGSTDVNTTSAKILDAAVASLRECISNANAKFDNSSDRFLADGSIWLHQAYNASAMAATLSAPKGTPEGAFRYWWPEDGRGIILNDTTTVLSGGSNPVLAHLFLNHLLQSDLALKNFGYTFYQQPVVGLTIDKIMGAGLVPESLKSALVREEQYGPGYAQGPLSQDAQILWQNAWAKVRSA